MQIVTAVTCPLFSLQDIILFSQSRNYFDWGTRVPDL